MNLSPLESAQPVIVYIDFKSPYAYLAIEPTRELERELDLQFDWRPFVLDIPSYLGSARLGESGQVLEQQRSAEQWSGVKYAYYDCRRYAKLQGLTIRGTEKIWDTHLAAAAMLWTKQFSHAATRQFIDSVYPRFWVRDLDLESESVVAGLLSDLGLDGAGFVAWAHAGGLERNADFQSTAFAAGIYGVPTYVVDGACYFGREHLPRIYWQLKGRWGPDPDIANPLPTTWLATQPDYPKLPERIVIGIDDSLDSLLAVPQLTEILQAYAGELVWLRVSSRMPGEHSVAADDLSRSAMHQRFRRANVQADTRRYGPPGVDPESYSGMIDNLLCDLNISISTEGPEQVLRPAMPGIVMLLDDEIFIGRQHLPLVAIKLGKKLVAH